MRSYIDKEYDTRREAWAASRELCRRLARRLGKAYPIPYTEIRGKVPVDPHEGDARFFGEVQRVGRGKFVVELPDGALGLLSESPASRPDGGEVTLPTRAVRRGDAEPSLLERDRGQK